MPLWKRNLLICWLGSFTCVAGMALVLPFLPLYFEELGVSSVPDVERWSGLAFGITFLMAAIVSPVWGRMADRHGRKLMLLRASGGMAVVTALMGFAREPWQLVALRFLMGAVSGYISAAITLVATQTPREQSGWALGVLSTGSVSGGLIGPLIGGYLAEVIGLRHVFFVTAAFMAGACWMTAALLVESFKPASGPAPGGREVWQAIDRPRMLLALFLTSLMLQFASLSIEPVVTVYVRQLAGHANHVALVAGLVISASGFANVLAAPRLGRLSDRIGPRRVLIGALAIAGLLILPQAFVQSTWQLGACRFGFGLAAAGLVPSVNTLVRRLAPDAVAGRIFGYNQSAQYLGNILGPVVGGLVAARWGIPHVFFVTAGLLLLNAFWVYAQVDPDRAASPLSSRPGEREA